MKILENFFFMSEIDKKALENDLLDSFDEWLKKAIAGFVFRAKQAIINPHMPLLRKDPEVQSIPTNDADLINLIISKDYFIKCRIPINKLLVNSRKTDLTIPVLQNGIDIQEFEKTAVDNFYTDFQAHIHSVIEEKIFRCRKRVIAEWNNRLRNDPNITEIPKDEDDHLSLIFALPDYANRVEREAQR